MRRPDESARRPAAWRSERAILAWLTLVAFGLRVFRLGTQSLWGDEAISVFRADLSIPEITAEVPREGTLPPLYYYLLHFWLPLAGRSEFAVRFLSLLFGVSAVALLYVLARRTLGGRAGVVAAALAALSPFWIYYAQETRTYALVTALVVLALYLLLRAGLDESWTGRRWPWCAYAVAAALAMCSYYFAGFALAAATLWLLARRRREPRVLARCLLAQLGALALLSPLLVYAAPSLVATAGSVSRANTPLPTVVRQLALTFSYGASASAEQVWPLVVAAAALAILGLLAMPAWTAALWGLLLAAPVLAIYVVSFVPQIGWARYFVAASPAWYALIAAGLVALGSGLRRVGAVGAMDRRPAPAKAVGLALAGAASLVILAGIGLSLRNYYFDPAYWRHDLRSAARQVDAVATPDVAVVVNGPRRFPSFFYYFRGNLPCAELPSGGVDTAEALAGLAARYRGLWLVKYRPPDYDPGGAVEAWLGEHAYKVRLRWVENVTYGFYATEDPVAPRLAWESPVGRTFGSDAELVSYRTSVVQAQGDDYLLVSLKWRALRGTNDDLAVFAHLLDGGGARLDQSDHRAVDGLRPAWTWQQGEVLDDRFALKLPREHVGRGLHLSVGLYLPDGRRVAPLGEPSPDGSLTLPLPALSPVQVARPLARRLGGGVALLGYDLASSPVRRGERLVLTLYWRRQGPIERSYTVFTHLLGPGERVVAQRDSPPLGGSRPTSAWLPGEVLTDRYELPIPPDLPPGRYQMEVGMYEPETGRRLPVAADAPDATAMGDRVLLPDAVEVAP